MSLDQLTVGAVIANASRAQPNTPAALVGGRTFTFSELDRAGTAVAEQLIERGLVRGAVAAVTSTTSFALLAHFVGCARAGVVFAPVNPQLPPQNLAAIREVLRADVALVAPEIADDEAVDGALWCDVDAVPSGRPLPALVGDDPHVAYLTSGTTGIPKAVLLSHRASVLRSHPGSQLEARGPALCPYPLFHMGGWTIAMQQWHARAPVVFVEGTDPETLVNAIREHRIERFNAIPGVWTRILDRADETDEPPFDALRFADTGTSPTSTELLERIATVAPQAQVRVFYGSSEAGNVASLAGQEVLAKPGSVGTPSVLTEARIDEAGELLVRGPLLFDRYLHAPESTAAALRDGWYHTGDRAEIDADGYLSIVGRLGSIIRTGGEAVSPSTVEAALLTHPEIEQAAVFGVPDNQWGEVVAAAVVASRPLTLDDLREHAAAPGAGALARHEIPRQLLLVDAIPRTEATNRVDVGQLKSLLRSP